MASPVVPSHARALDLRALRSAPAPAGDRSATSLVAPALSVDSSPADSVADALRRAAAWDGPAFVWAAPDGSILAAIGAAARFECSGSDRFLAVRRWLDAIARRAEGDDSLRSNGPDEERRSRLIAVGGFSFAEGSAGAPTGLGDAVFVVPQEIWRAAPGEPGERIAWSGRAAHAPVPASAEREGQAAAAARRRAQAGVPEWDEAEWTRAARTILDRIRSGSLSKAVLARGATVEHSSPIDAARVVDRLMEENPHGYRFLFRPYGGAAFLGASPERLVRLRDGAVLSDAVAGTSADGSLDDSLLRSAKDRSEHSFVIRHIVETLAPICDRVEADAEPVLERHRHLAHLTSRVRGAARPGAHVLDLVARLHPTPAVAGSPRDPALALIRSLEPFHRGWYAGAVGWMDARGDGEFAVGIRSAMLEGRRAILLAGAGIVAYSDPAAEWAETEMKLAVMREAIEHAAR